MSSRFGTVIMQHAGLHVSSLEKTVAWYQEVLGFELISSRDDTMMPGVFPKCWLMKLGDFYLELFETPSARPFSYETYEYEIGVKHLDFWIEDLDGLMEWIYERGDITVVVDNRYTEERCEVPGGDRAVWVLDCNDMLVEFSQVKSRG
ncbi:VOC family protein [Lachnospiraceae bacterium ZAX-1]